VKPGTLFCCLNEASHAYLEAWDEHGKDQSERFFSTQGTGYLLKQPVMPAMLTSDHDIVRMDCLCYLMERIDWTSIMEETEPEIVPVQTS
jgi:hypothetical protein